MKKKTNACLFLIGISLFGCDSAKSPVSLISNVDTDFPITEELEFKPFNKYEILETGHCMIDDSILWYFSGSDKHSIGSCYHLNTGEKLSTIAMKGNAANEFVNLGNPSSSRITDDSIQLHSSYFDKKSDVIKTFAIKDIIENKPMNERQFSVAMVPDSINATQFMKLPNGSILATIDGSYGKKPLPEKFDINNKSFVIINNNEVKGYETINYDSFDVKITDPESNSNPNFVIKNAYSTGNIVTRGNDMAAFSACYQFILYTFDLKRGSIINEKRYTEMKSDGGAMTTNEMEMLIGIMKSNDKYIYCAVVGYFSKKDKELGLRKRALFVFDWNLNPIKKFNLPSKKNTRHIISEDCSSIYIGEYTDEGFVLTKADLNI